MSAARPLFHGGALDRAMAEHGGQPGDWLDLSTGINPRPWPAPRLSREALARLPLESDLARLIAAARKAYGVPKHLGVTAAPGTQALIEALPRLLPGKRAVIIAPAAGTYREHAHCCAKAGREVSESMDMNAIDGSRQLAILVRPNNPDGGLATRKDVIGLAARLAAQGGHLVIDEAYCDATPRESLIADCPPNAIILRSFGKFFGLAGIRLGFAIASVEIAAQLSGWFGPWAVSGPAIEIGTAALGDKKWIANTKLRLTGGSAGLATLLERAGFEIAGANALFVLVRHRQAEFFAYELARRHILVRPFPERPGQIRFGLPPSLAALRRLGMALDQIRGEVA